MTPILIDFALPLVCYVTVGLVCRLTIAGFSALNHEWCFDILDASLKYYNPVKG